MKNDLYDLYESMLAIVPAVPDQDIVIEPAGESECGCVYDQFIQKLDALKASGEDHTDIVSAAYSLICDLTDQQGNNFTSQGAETAPEYDHDTNV